MPFSTLTDLHAALTIQVAQGGCAGLGMSRQGTLRLPAWQPLER